MAQAKQKPGESQIHPKPSQSHWLPGQAKPEHHY